MRRMAGLLTLILCLTLLFGCGKTEDVSRPEPSSSTTPSDEPVQGPQSFSLAYSKDDTLDPYAARTEVNWELAGLLSVSISRSGVNHRLKRISEAAAKLRMQEEGKDEAE